MTTLRAVWQERLRPDALRLYPGLLAALVVAIAATFLGSHYGAPVMLFALLLGMVMNFLSGRACKPGINWRHGRCCALVGAAGLAYHHRATGVTRMGAVLLVVCSVALTIGGGVVAARLMVSTRCGFLSGGSVGICGASATIAISAALRRIPARACHAVHRDLCERSVNAAMIAYQCWPYLGLSPHAAGIFLGATIHGVAQVVGAGYAMSPRQAMWPQ
jgi:uncharacterized membrane protein YadS